MTIFAMRMMYTSHIMHAPFCLNYEKMMTFFDGRNGNDGNNCFYACELIRGMVKGRG